MVHGTDPSFFVVSMRHSRRHCHAPLHYQGHASNGKLDIVARSKTPLADYGGFSQALVQVCCGCPAAEDAAAWLMCGC
jgi:hypothetical protein